MYQDEKARCDKPQVDLARLIIRLRMVTVDLGGTLWRQIALQEAHGVADGEADVAQAALIGPPRCVADDDRQNIDAEVVVVWPPYSAAEQKASVAATQIDN